MAFKVFMMIFFPSAPRLARSDQEIARYIEGFEDYAASDRRQADPIAASNGLEASERLIPVVDPGRRATDEPTA